MKTILIDQQSLKRQEVTSERVTLYCYFSCRLILRRWSGLFFFLILAQSHKIQCAVDTISVFFGYSVVFKNCRYNELLHLKIKIRVHV